MHSNTFGPILLSSYDCRRFFGEGSGGFRDWLRDLSLAEDLLHSSDLTTFQADFDAMAVTRRFREEVFHYAFCQFSGGLVFLHYYRNPGARFYVCPICAGHGANSILLL